MFENKTLKKFPQFFQKVYTREEIGSNLWQQCNIKNDNKIGEMFTLHTGVFSTDPTINYFFVIAI
jgi:hypothetical protein